MNDTAELFPETATGPALLRVLEVFNWGPFGGLHRAVIDPRGSAIIGPTGSGKTTLVDALMTLLVPQPRYNLASTGGHESDRDLLSYVRGVTGAGNESGDNEHIARPGKTISAIHARFGEGEQALSIGALLWLDGTSNAPSDLKRLWLFARRDDQDLAQWLGLFEEGGARALKQYAKEGEALRAHDSKKAFLAQLRRHFEVGENAFTLLNRAAGLKQLNSIDEIFRELVLDDRSAFTRAAEVAAEFDDLAAIHAELETARRQQQSLAPIEPLARDHHQCQEELARLQRLQQILPIHYALHGQRLWGEELGDLEQAIAGHDARIAELTQQQQQRRREADTLKTLYLQAGGTSIEQLKELIDKQRQQLEQRRLAAGQYTTLCANLSLDDSLSAEALQANQRQVTERQEALGQAQQALEEQQLQSGAALVEQRRRRSEVEDELGKIRARPGSNLPGHYQDFRAELARALDLDEEQLPFLAELMEVKAEESRWRGAIERALGGHRLRILVPSEAMRAALDWVNHRDNRLHVRLLEAQAPAQAAHFHDDGFCRRLNFKPHPHREALKGLLAGLDRHCVETPAALRDTPHGMTAEGLMSGKKGMFEKQDQRPLNEGWMTGFDNRDRLAELERELAQLKEELERAEADHRQTRDELKRVAEQQTLLERLTELDYPTIDLPGAEAELASLQQRLEQLTAPDSDAARARQQYEEAEEVLEALHERIREQEHERSRLLERRDSAAGQRDNASARIGEGLDDADRQLAAEALPTPEAAQLRQLDNLERQEGQRLGSGIEAAGNRLKRLEQKLVRQMETAQRTDTGALAESGSELQDIPDYLERLRVLNEEALPEKQARFLDYLNQSSDQGVTQLLSGIDNEVHIIEERIEDLNATLRRVDFQPGRYLQLQPRRVVHESLRTLQSAQRRLASAALADDGGESHYRALAELVALLRDAAENKRTLGARALLDPRYRLQFAVSVIERDGGRIIETRTGSQGGSGGEKEIIASYILTASLSYALCPEGSSRPLFGTIVLDEAFSKSSQAVAGRIVSALREFGLHPLFVTPNKEMRLLRAHTRSAILVHRKGLQATLTDISWEELEAHAKKKLLDK